MKPPKSFRTEAVVLKRSRLREADSLLTLYTPRFGKIRAVAKGALRPKSKLRGHVEPLIYSQIQLTQGQDLDTVTQGETLESFLPLRDDLLTTSYAIYIAELTDRFTPEGEANYSLFQLLVHTLRRLCQAHNDITLLMHFELHLLDQLGYRPELYRCVNCDSPLTPITNFFSITDGGVVCPACHQQEHFLRPLSINALKVLRFLQRNDYLTTQRIHLSPELSLDLQPLLHGYITYLLEREVKSMTWIDRLRARDRLAGQQY